MPKMCTLFFLINLKSIHHNVNCLDSPTGNVVLVAPPSPQQNVGGLYLPVCLSISLVSIHNSLLIPVIHNIHTCTIFILCENILL